MNPGDINNPRNISISNLKLTSSSCAASQLLKDLNLDHNEIVDCEKELTEKVGSWVAGLSKLIEARVLMKELDRKVSGLWCTIL